MIEAGKHNPRDGWSVMWRTAEVFKGEAGDALLTFDNMLSEVNEDGGGGNLSLVTPNGHAIAIHMFPLHNRD